eukprot:m.22697 g.22697  ORF g.22697 m.22697 type:complete len:168 (-) comp4023_c0_seq2:589-1092(-)
MHLSLRSLSSSVALSCGLAHRAHGHRQSVVMLARAYGLQAIDVVNIRFRDEEGLVAESREGAGFGFTGKQVIHPNQVSPVQKAFSPSEEQVQWAVDIYLANQQNSDLGLGAFSFSGQMIDAPTLKQALNVIEEARACGTFDECRLEVELPPPEESSPNVTANPSESK